MSLDLLNDLFLDFLRTERGLSGNTLEAYSRDLRDYLEALGKARCAGRGRHRSEHVQKHLAALHKRGLSHRSQARNLAAIRGFHRFLLRERHSRKDRPRDLETRGPA
jgi:integrase/recombinase XerD